MCWCDKQIHLIKTTVWCKAAKALLHHKGSIQIGFTMALEDRNRDDDEIHDDEVASVAASEHPERSEHGDDGADDGEAEASTPTNPIVSPGLECDEEKEVEEPKATHDPYSASSPTGSASPQTIHPGLGGSSGSVGPAPKSPSAWLGPAPKSPPPPVPLTRVVPKASPPPLPTT